MGWFVGMIGMGTLAADYQDSVSESSSAVDTTVAFPTGAQVGDLLLLSVASQFDILSVENNGVLGDDWAFIRTDVGVGSIGNVYLHLWYHVMEPGDGSVKVTWISGNRYALSLIAYSGVDSAAPIDAHDATVSVADGTTATAPSVTASAGGRVVECFGTIRWQTGTITGPVAVRTSEALLNNFYGNAVSDQAAAGGASGTHTAGVGTAGWVAQTVALKPG